MLHTNTPAKKNFEVAMFNHILETYKNVFLSFTFYLYQNFKELAFGAIVLF